MLRQELFSKGIDEEKAEKAIEELYSDRSEFDVAKDLVQKRVRKSKMSEEEMKKQKKKLSQFLLRRGFDWGVISEVLQEE